METKVLVICTIAGFLGLLSAILGFAAEGQRIKRSEVDRDSRNSSVCVYPRSPAFGLGVVAALALLVAHIIINVASGCICCCRRYARPANSRWHWAVALVCFIISWFTFVLAFLLLLASAILNVERTMDSMYVNYNCYVVVGGVFAFAASLSFISVALGIVYYLSLSSEKRVSGEPSVTPASQTNGIAMGQAHVPPTSQEPVFVHEDTYARRQFT